MAHLGAFSATTKIAVTTTSPVSPFTAPGPSDARQHTYVLTADADIFIERNAAATTSSAYVPAKTSHTIVLFGLETLAYVTASTANLYITEISP